MARQFDPDQELSADDIAYLKERHPVSFVERMVELHGAASAALQASEAGDPAEAEVDEPEAAEEAVEGSEEDLIGDGVDLFDPQDHTEAEIKAHLEEFPDDRERVLGLEAEGRQRKGVLAL